MKLPILQPSISRVISASLFHTYKITRMNKLPIFGVVTALLASSVANDLRAEDASLANAVPSGAIAFAEISGLDDVIGQIQASELRQMVLDSPQYQDYLKSPNYAKVMAGKTLVEGQIGMDLWTAGKQLLGGRIGLAVYPQPGRKQPDAVVIVRAAEAGSIDKLHQRMQPFITLAGIEPGDKVDDVQFYDIKGKVFVGVAADWFVASSKRELLDSTVKLMASSNAAGSLSSDEPYQAMIKQMGQDHLIHGFVNLETIRSFAPRLGLPQKVENPLGSLLASGVLELAKVSPYFGLTVDADASGFAITTGISGKSGELEKPFAPFFSNASGPGADRLPQVPNLLGGISIHRDFAGWYRNREHLIRDDVLPAFDKFETGIANILPGRDFGLDVLPKFGSNLSFLAAPQSFDHLDGKPGVELPGFAMVIELADAGGYDIAQLFFQTLVTITNIEAGKQGRQPWVMSSETHNETQIAYAKFLKKPKGERLPIVFNFVPASARVGDRFVLASSVSLCRQIVDQLKKPATSPADGNRNFNVELHFKPIADLVETNRDFLAAQEIQKGKEPEQVAKELDAGLRLLRMIESLRFSTSVKSDSFQAQLEGSWDE